MHFQKFLRTPLFPEKLREIASGQIVAIVKMFCPGYLEAAIQKYFQNCLWVVEAVTKSCSVSKAFLKISQNSQENTWPEALTKSLKKRQHRVFPVNFAKFFRTPFLQKSSGSCFYFGVQQKEIHVILNRLWHKCFPLNFARFSYRTPPVAASVHSGITS